MMMQLMHRDFFEQKDGLLDQEIQPPQNPPCPAVRCPPALLPAPLPCPVSLAPPLPRPPLPSFEVIRVALNGTEVHVQECRLLEL